MWVSSASPRGWRVNERTPLAGRLEQDHTPQRVSVTGTRQMSAEKADVHKKGWGFRTAGSGRGVVGAPFHSLVSLYNVKFSVFPNAKAGGSLIFQ